MNFFLSSSSSSVLTTVPVETWPSVVGVVGFVYSISVLGMKYFSDETESIFEGFSYIFSLCLTIPFNYMLGLSKKAHSEKEKMFLAVGICIIQMFVIRSVYHKYVTGKKFKNVKLDGKVYIVTGSNTGIGLETVKELVRMGGVVIMACRTKEKAEAAKSYVIQATGADVTKVIILKLELSSYDSVRQFVKDFHSLGLPLHCLINNAGAFQYKREMTKDNCETTIQSNHLSSFLLTHLLLDDLKKTNGRIVNLTSALHKKPKSFNFKDVMSEKKFTTFGSYGQSKLANVMTTIEQNRRLQQENSKVTCNAVHPGIVRTEVSRNLGPFLYYGQLLATPILMFMQKTPLQGAYCSIHVATSPDLEGIGGLYFEDSEVCRFGDGAIISDDNKKLWNLSEKLSGLVNIDKSQ